MRRILPLVSLGALLVVAPPVHAEPAPPSVAVRYADLDLSRPAGAAALDRRIDQAVRRLCGDASALDPRGRREIRRCRSEARSSVSGHREQAIASAQRQGTLASIR